MLVRSAGRRQRHTSRLLAASFSHLNLPWLAPAQLRWSASHSSTTVSPSDSTSTRKRSPLARIQTSTRSRGLATAADHYTPFQDQLPPPGFSQSQQAQTAGLSPPFDITSTPAHFKSPSLRPYNDPIIINTTTRTPDEYVRVQAGLHGTVRELLVHLHTSVVVGRLERAQAIVGRLVEQCGHHSPEIIYAHHAVLGEMLQSLATNPTGSLRSKAILADMQRWFEVEIRNRQVPLDAKMLVIMVRASISALEGSRLDRSLRRYAEIARDINDTVFEEVLNSEEYDDNEFTVLGAATSEYYEDEVALPGLAEAEAVRSEESESTANTRDSEFTDLSTIPEVLTTDQKSGGVADVKTVLSSLTGLPALSSQYSPEARRRRAYERQRALETSTVEVAIDKWRRADEDLRKLGIHTAMQTKPFGALLWQWYAALLPMIRQEFEACDAFLNKGPTGKQSDDRMLYGPYLELTKPETVAATTIMAAMTRLVNSKNRATDFYESEVKVNALTLTIAAALQDDYLASQSGKPSGSTSKRSRGGQTRRKVRPHVTQDTGSEVNAEAAVDQSSTPTELATDPLDQREWPLEVRVKLGAMLLSKLIECAQLPVTRDHPRTGEKVTQMQPAFMHRMKYSSGRKTGVIQPNVALIEKLQSEPLGGIVGKRMPMLVEPKPWTGWSEGGYLSTPTSILRLTNGDKSGKDYFTAAAREGDMSTVYKGLTALGKVAWKVNNDVFKVQLEAWNSGEGLGGFAPLSLDLPIPPEPEANLDPSVRKEWVHALRDIENKKMGNHSQRCSQNFQMEIARSLLNETLYFPHNLDFRGRAYPIPPYLNHMGADNVRALLTFANGKELGASGLRWLKIHTATVAGHDKASMEDRVRFTEQHLDDIMDSAQNPLTGRKWWLQAEDAWQTLAACIELSKALASPDPEKFISHLPVQQDGTCNGLQHYAALGGDQAGAEQVNLEPSDKPADVYTAVAEAVKAEVRKDAAAGSPIAKLLDGRITRKCVKQPVMTNVYGVTFYGAKLQVVKQLDTILPRSEMPDNIKKIEVADYVARKIFQSLGNMFTGAQAIQKWLGVCADRISTALSPEQVEQALAQSSTAIATGTTKGKSPRAKASKATKNKPEKPLFSEPLNAEQSVSYQAKPFFRSSVVWTTPLRLPVVQPYRTSTAKVIKTSLQGLSIQEPQVWDPVNKRKQLQAFPPNFIHSLDSSHMLLSALKFDELGKTFASVHDSFWTHACDIDDLSEVLRDAFISMHSEDIIARLREEFQTRYSGSFHLVSVLKNSDVGKKIIAARKNGTIASKDHTTDFNLEVERQRLLNSSAPEEREQGAQMLTPGSIVEACGGIDGYDSAAELKGQGLGETANTPNGTITAIDQVAEEEAAEGPDVRVMPEPMDTVLSGGLEQAGAEANAEDQAVTAPKRKASARLVQRMMYVWMPMEFPPVPAKGSFDVTKIQGSKYFFH